MTTPRQLLVITMNVSSERPVRSGDLSLALAGAELIDLYRAGAVELSEDRITPGPGPAPADVLLEQAFGSLRREEPHESIGDWLWRRGDALAEAYFKAFEAEGLLTRRRRRGHPFQAAELVLADSAVRREAAELRSRTDPALSALAGAVGIWGEGPDGRPQDAPEVTDDTVAYILAAAGDSMTELETERQRRDIEQSAFDNVWRNPDV
ncbi:GPP34 family phosphoprotein [Streptomyces sp. NPDC057428]|uniref:GOLPH3/VPS74 family protein n=1 Tax=Streptomyces sp. NPDC057428 TaxID=3346129 RepID=UPI0036B703D1